MLLEDESPEPPVPGEVLVEEPLGDELLLELLEGDDELLELDESPEPPVPDEPVDGEVAEPLLEEPVPLLLFDDESLLEPELPD